MTHYSSCALGYILNGTYCDFNEEIQQDVVFLPLKFHMFMAALCRSVVAPFLVAKLNTFIDCSVSSTMF